MCIAHLLKRKCVCIHLLLRNNVEDATLVDASQLIKSHSLVGFLKFGVLLQCNSGNKPEMAFWKKKSLSSFVDGFRPPFRCGGHKYYDSLLNQVEIYPRCQDGPEPQGLELNRAWEVFRQTFIDECFNKGISRRLKQNYYSLV